MLSITNTVQEKETSIVSNEGYGMLPRNSAV